MIDGHCHVLPPELREPGSPAWEDPWFAVCHATKSPRFAAGRDVLAAMDEVGIEQAVIFGWPFADPGLLRESNDYTAYEVKGGGGRLRGMATVNPSDQGAVAELARCQALGLRGLGELNCDAQGFEPVWGGGLRATLKACEEMDWPVLLHASEPVGHPYAGKGTATPAKMWGFLPPLLDEAPRLRLCLAHLGGGLPFYSHMPEVRSLCKRLWFDTAAIPFLYGTEVLPALIALVGSGRVCFGSDFPLLRPSRYRAHLQSLGEGPGGAWLAASTLSWLGDP